MSARCTQRAGQGAAPRTRDIRAAVVAHDEAAGQEEPDEAVEDEGGEEGGLEHDRQERDVAVRELAKLVPEVAPLAQGEDEGDEARAVEGKADGDVLLHDKEGRGARDVARREHGRRDVRRGVERGLPVRLCRRPHRRGRHAHEGHAREGGEEVRLQRPGVDEARGDDEPVPVEVGEAGQRPLLAVHARDAHELPVDARLEGDDEEHDARLPRHVHVAEAARDHKGRHGHAQPPPMPAGGGRHVTAALGVHRAARVVAAAAALPHRVVLAVQRAREGGDALGRGRTTARGVCVDPQRGRFRARPSPIRSLAR